MYIQICKTPTVFKLKACDILNDRNNKCNQRIRKYYFCRHNRQIELTKVSQSLSWWSPTNNVELHHPPPLPR